LAYDISKRPRSAGASSFQYEICPGWIHPAGVLLTGAASPRILRVQDMVWIEGGSFLMGTEDGYPEEAPVREVAVEGFWIDPYAVTNRDWNRFVKETGHVTLAERPASAEDYPDADPERLVPSSSVSCAQVGQCP
jgi:formylglycine-generating enzyme